MKQLTNGAVEYNKTSLTLPKKMTYEQWEKAGQTLQQMSGGINWWLGDWLNYGESAYGEKYTQAIETTGLELEVLKKCAYVSSNVSESGRASTLSWTHHREVASLPPKEQKRWLKKAEKESLSVRELKGELNAARIAEESVELPTGKYQVIYADPPWQFTSGDQHGVEAQDTVLGDHYPSMPLAAICELEVEALAADNCLLFIWATSPTLEEAFQVINSWGFEYKAQMIWDKVKHNVGHYVSVRHEILLICKRGLTPKVSKLVDSVYEEERTKHSKKPEYFRDLIVELYPKLKRIELFARATDKNWDAWGNEV